MSLKKPFDIFSSILQGNVIECLANHEDFEAQINNKPNGFSPLYLASGLGFHPIVCHLICFGAIINDYHYDGSTPLYNAVYYGNTKICKILLLNGAVSEFVNTRTGFTPLFLAALKGDYAIANLLIKSGANVNFKTEHSGASPLIAALERGHEYVAKFLIESGSSLDTVETSKENTPLTLAVEKGLYGICDLLLKAGVDPNIKRSSDNVSPLAIAVKKGYWSIVELLLERHAIVDQGEYLLHAAAENGLTKICELLVGYITDLNIGRGELQETALFLAAERGSGSICEIIAKHDIDIDKPRSDGKTPLFEACKNGYYNAAYILIQYGADVDLPDAVNGITPLTIAAFNGHLEICKLLLENGAEIEKLEIRKSEAIGGSLQSPMSAALISYNFPIVKLLFENKAVFNYEELNPVLKKSACFMQNMDDYMENSSDNHEKMFK